MNRLQLRRREEKMTISRLGLATAASACAILAISPLAAAPNNSLRFAQAAPPSDAKPNGEEKKEEEKKEEEKKEEKQGRGDRAGQPSNAGPPGGAPNVSRPQILNPNVAKPGGAAPNGTPDAGQAKREAPRAPQVQPKPAPQPTAAPNASDQKPPEAFSRTPATRGDDRDAKAKQEKPAESKQAPSDGGAQQPVIAPKPPNKQTPPESVSRPDGPRPEGRDWKATRDRQPPESDKPPSNAESQPSQQQQQTGVPEQPKTPPSVGRWNRPGVTIKDIKSARKERREAGGKRLVIEEPDKRTIVEQDNRIAIERDERERMRRFTPNARVQRGQGGNTVSIVERGDAKIYSETDERGRLVRRYRRDGSGRESIIIDNRRKRRGSGRDVAIGVGIGAGVIAGAAILDSLVRVPAPRVTIPREKYIVRGEGASDDDYYEALSAPPVERYDDRYTLDEIRATPHLRERMRRIDLDDVNFAFGAWDIDPSQYGKLERLARAIKRVLSRNPDEVFMIEGHTDAVGSRVDNLTLSDRRAESVAYILTKEFGVPFESLVTQGYGEEYLKVPTEAPEELNRRVAAMRITPLLARGLAARSDDDGRGEPAQDDRGGAAGDEGGAGPADDEPGYDGPDDGGAGDYEDRDGPPR